MIKLEYGDIYEDGHKIPMYLPMTDINPDEKDIEKYVQGLRQYIEVHWLNAWVATMLRKYPLNGRTKYAYQSYLIEQDVSLVEATFLSERISASR